MSVATIALEDPRWRELVETHPMATPFHLPEWSSSIIDCYRFDGGVLALLESDGELMGGMPFVRVRLPFQRERWVSLPFTDTCPPLLREGASIEPLAQAVRDRMSRGEIAGFELRGVLPEAPDVHYTEVGTEHVMELHEDASKLKLRKGHRQTLNRAIRDGVRVTRGASRTDVDVFYRLHTLTRRGHGVPVQPRHFFDLLYERLIAKGYGFISTAKVDDQIVAAGVYLAHNQTVIAKYHASDPEMRRISAGYVVDWDTIVAAGADGYRYLALGRTDLGAEGLRRYKARWGSVEMPLVYTQVCAKEPSPRLLSGGDLSHRIVQRSPVWVCRALGEVLYRWTA